MKRFFLLALSLLPTLLFAQTVHLGAMSSEYDNGEFHFLYDTYKRDCYLDCSWKDSSNRFSIKMNRANMDAFVTAIEKVKTIYLKWAEIATSGNIVSFSKKIKQSIPDQKIMFLTKDNSWGMEKGVDLTPIFFADDKGGTHLIIKSDYMESSERVEGHSDLIISGANIAVAYGQTQIQKFNSGFNIIFSSEQEINQFIDLIKSVIKVDKRTEGSSVLFEK